MSEEAAGVRAHLNMLRRTARWVRGAVARSGGAPALTYRSRDWDARGLGPGWNAGTLDPQWRQAFALAKARTGNDNDQMHGAFYPWLVSHNMELSVFHAVACAAGNAGSAVRVLDFGGGPAPFFWSTRELAPHLALQWSVVEVQQIAALGRQLVPEVAWWDSSDPRWREQRFDLAVISGSLQYLEHWETFLREMVPVAPWMLLTRVPVVNAAEGYVCTQELSPGVRTLHRHFSRSQLLACLASAGWAPVHEYVVEGEIPARGVPVPSRMAGWLLRGPGG